MNWQWISHYRYNHSGHIGKVVCNGKEYFLLLSTGVTIAIDSKFGRTCRAVEERQNVFAQSGRPALFPGKKSTARLITLPNELWERIGRPYSQQLAEKLYGIIH